MRKIASLVLRFGGLHTLRIQLPLWIDGWLGLFESLKEIIVWIGPKDCPLLLYLAYGHVMELEDAIKNSTRTGKRSIEWVLKQLELGVSWELPNLVIIQLGSSRQ
jgi:hypothetical protein